MTLPNPSSWKSVQRSDPSVSRHSPPTGPAGGADPFCRSACTFRSCGREGKTASQSRTTPRTNNAPRGRKTSANGQDPCAWSCVHCRRDNRSATCAQCRSPSEWPAVRRRRRRLLAWADRPQRCRTSAFWARREARLISWPIVGSAAQRPRRSVPATQRKRARSPRFSSSEDKSTAAASSRARSRCLAMDLRPLRVGSISAVSISSEIPSAPRPAHR